VAATVDHIVHRGYHVEERMTLAVTVRQEGEDPYPCWALNEVSVEKAARERMIEVAVEIVIADAKAHTRLFHSIFTERDPAQHAFFRESTFAAVHERKARC